MEVATEKEREETPNLNQAKATKGKSCKGCLYYSSNLKSKSRNPRCVGLTRALQVHGYAVGETEMEASKEGRNLTDFKYGCLGYSVYLDGKDSSSNLKDRQAELPLCAGLELLVDKRVSTVDNVPNHLPAAVHNKEGDRVPPPRTQIPAHIRGSNFMNRFVRNSGLVAAGVAKNLSKVGNALKQSLTDNLDPYGRRSK